MSKQFNRRQFIGTSAAATTGLLLPGSTNLSGAPVATQTDSRLIRLGLNALARAPQMKYFTDGHRGAALISAHLMCANNKLEKAAMNRIVELFDLNWAKSKLCLDFPQGDRIEDATDRIGQALAGGKGVLREVGHDAIFAMHAIKAFRMMPEFATRERVDGVRNLIKAIKPWRDIKPDPSIKPPPFKDQVAASKFILKEASDAIDRFVGFGQGFAGHMLTFGQSLVELAAMGDVEVAESCRVAFCKYVTVTRQGPKPTDRKIKEHKFTKLRPDEVEYWQKRGHKTLGIGHVFKYPYAYYDLLARAQDTSLQQQFENKAWRLF
ncbi:MAG: hypothetical protein NXI04_03415 [Planctomycetaceae bacterium]|nr:hypothetical protein [Planctomycetaceae bacterium]